MQIELQCAVADHATSRRIGHANVAVLQPHHNALQLARWDHERRPSAQVGDPPLLSDLEAQGRNRQLVPRDGRLERLPGQPNPCSSPAASICGF